jgi:hypothetical protein
VVGCLPVGTTPLVMAESPSPPPCISALGVPPCIAPAGSSSRPCIASIERPRSAPLMRDGGEDPRGTAAPCPERFLPCPCILPPGPQPRPCIPCTMGAAPECVRHGPHYSTRTPCCGGTKGPTCRYREGRPSSGCAARASQLHTRIEGARMWHGRHTAPLQGGVRALPDTWLLCREQRVERARGDQRAGPIRQTPVEPGSQAATTLLRTAPTPSRANDTQPLQPRASGARHRMS